MARVVVINDKYSTKPVLVVYPTALPAIPLAKNLLANFTLDMRNPQVHTLVCPEILTASDRDNLVTILCGLMPQELLLSEDDRDMDAEVYATLIVDGKHYSFVSDDDALAIANLLDSKHLTTITLIVHNNCYSYANTIARMLYINIFIY